MKSKGRIRSVLILTFVCFLPLFVNGQKNFGVSDISIAFIDVKYGIPFEMLIPIHPGIEFGTTFFRNEKEKSTYTFDAALGYYHHSILTDAIYFTTKYNLGLKLKNVIGLDFHAGIGALYSKYAGNAFAFNENTLVYDRVTDTKVYAVLDAGIGMTYIASQKVQPFIHYDFNSYNLWEFGYLNTTAVLKAGVKIILNQRF